MGSKFILLLVIVFTIGYVSSTSSKPITILVMGNAGVGKSSLINFLMNDTVAKVSDYATGTIKVDKYNFYKYGNNFIFYDSPGLNDGENDNNIIKMIGEKIDNINILLICVDVSRPRLYNEEKEMISEIKKKFGNKIMKNCILIFTKSNLNSKFQEIGDHRAKKLKKYTGSIPYFYAFNNEVTDNNWRHNLWQLMTEYSRNNKYFIRSNYYRYSLCDPLQTIVSKSRSSNIYPSNTNKIFQQHYDNCVENIKKEYALKKQRNAFIGMASFFVIFLIVGTLTGGGAGLIGSLATIGGGSLAAGGFGINGGIIALATLGFSAGLQFTEFPPNECTTKVKNELDILINSYHYDQYLYQNNEIAFEGYFLNNVPHGKGSTYDENGKLIWKGRFINGKAEICIFKIN